MNINNNIHKDDLKIIGKIRELPARQQIALWVILKNFHKSERTFFTTSDLIEKMGKFLVEKDPEKSGHIMGGIISSLSRNKVIEPVSGGRQPIWQVVPEIHKDAKKYEKAIFPVTTYWP